MWLGRPPAPLLGCQPPFSLSQTVGGAVAGLAAAVVLPLYPLSSPPSAILPRPSPPPAGSLLPPAPMPWKLDCAAPGDDSRASGRQPPPPPPRCLGPALVLAATAPSSPLQPHLSPRPWHLPSPRPRPSFPMLSALPPALRGSFGGRGHPDQRRHVCCHRLPWWGSSTTEWERSKKVHVVGVPFVASPHRLLTLEHQPTPEGRGHCCVSPSHNCALPRLWLPRHLGAIASFAHTPVSAPAATFVPSRRCGCEGIQPVGFYLRLLLRSHRM